MAHKTMIICDKCKREQELTEEQLNYCKCPDGWEWQKTSWSDGNYCHLCPECTEAFKNWLKKPDLT